MTQSTIEVLPCPFCGGQPSLHVRPRDGHDPGAEGGRAYFYTCDSCAAVGGWGKSEGSALRLWNMRSVGQLCRGEGCPRADLCRRHTEVSSVQHPRFFERTPLLRTGECGEFVSNGSVRKEPWRCGGAHPPPRCTWQCSIKEEPN